MNAFVVWKVIYQGVIYFNKLISFKQVPLRISCLKNSEIDFKMHVQIQSHNFISHYYQIVYICLDTLGKRLSPWEQLTKYLNNFIDLNNLFYSNRFPRELVVLAILMLFLPFILQSVQNGLADFNYFKLKRVIRFINKVINVMSLMIYCLIFSILHVTFKRH